MEDAHAQPQIDPYYRFGSGPAGHGTCRRPGHRERTGRAQPDPVDTRSRIVPIFGVDREALIADGHVRTRRRIPRGVRRFAVEGRPP